MGGSSPNKVIESVNFFRNSFLFLLFPKWVLGLVMPNFNSTKMTLLVSLEVTKQVSTELSLSFLNSMALFSWTSSKSIVSTSVKRSADDFRSFLIMRFKSFTQEGYFWAIG